MRRSLLLLGPLAIYLAGVALLGGWIIDDAGISYAYARNAAAGHGLVAQPGRAPVEGFSDLLWVVLLIPLFWLRLFDPIITAKVLGAALVAGGLWLVARALRREASGDALGAIAIALAAAAPPIVIWSVSGLENGLTLLLAATLLAHAIERPRMWHARAGVLAGLLGATHPGGLVLALFGPALAFAGMVRIGATRLRAPDGGDVASAGVSSSGAADGGDAAQATAVSTGESLGSEHARTLGAVGKELLAFVAGLAAVLVPLFAFRLAVFGRWLPHTYYAKRTQASFGDRLTALAADPGAVLERLAGLCRGALGPPGPVLVGLTLAGALHLGARGRLARPARMSVTLLLIALAGYAFIDDDWMGEHRFGTAAVLFAITSLVTVAASALGAASARASRRAWLLGGGALVAAQCVFAFPRIVRFAANPPTPFADVDRSLARRFDAYAGALGLGRASVLLPDVGATLYGSRLTVIDAAGLCEPDVVRTLKRGGPVWLYDHPAFYDLVFEDLRPTFLSTHHFWTLVTAFDLDPRFARDYVAIDAHVDEYVQRTFGRTLRSGDFVRRDALPDPAALARLRSVYKPSPRLDPLVVRLADSLTGATGGADGGAAAQAVVDRWRAEADAALAADDPNRAASLLARVLERRPVDVGAAFTRARALDAAVRAGEARAEWVRVLDLAPPGSPVAASARARLDGLPLLAPAP